MDKQEIILSAEEHFAEGKPQKNQSQEKPKQAEKQNAIIHEKQKLKSRVDLDDDDLLIHIIDSDEESKDQEDLPEYITMNVKKLHKLLDCQLCKGIPRKVKTIKCCLRRFCGECIDQWLKLGNKVCPACQTSCPDQEATIEDHNRDRLVAICFPHTEELEKQDKDLQLMDDKSVQNQRKKSKRGVADSPYSSTSQSIPATPEASFFPSEEMLNRVARQVANAIIKHKTKEAQKLPRIDEKK